MSCDKKRVLPDINIDKGFHYCRIIMTNGGLFIGFLLRTFGSAAFERGMIEVIGVAC